MKTTIMTRGLLLSLTGVLGLAIGLPANAATTRTVTTPPATTRTAVVPLKAKPYYTGANGGTYTIRGTVNQVKMRVNHQLKNYTRTTWIVTARTDVTQPNGQRIRYYRGKNSRNGAVGWIGQSQLKAGRNHQVNTAKKFKAKNYVKVKRYKKTAAPARKVYQLVGKTGAMQWRSQHALSSKRTYRVTKQRTYYEAGKAYKYDYVTSGSIRGWVWAGDLTAGTYYDVAKKQRAIKQKLQKYLNSVTKDGTATVAFYNLAPKAGSKAAKAKHATVYAKGKLAANSKGSKVTISASTYKLYMAAYLMHLKQQGRFSWTKANTTGMCDMIIHSANYYPVGMLNRYGRTNINRWLQTQGYGAPFSNYRDSVTTANNLIKVLRDLQEGKKAFTNKSDRAHILRLMGKQDFRRGIPTGAAQAMRGTKVQDKVGFLYSNNSDAGIVTLPNGHRYLLVIMTWGHNQAGRSGFPRIANIAKHVQQIVY